jgi:VWFA-related protein
VAKGRIRQNIRQGLNRLRKKGKGRVNFPEKRASGAKSRLFFQLLAARLKPCPCYKTGVFPQPVKPVVYSQLFAARLKLCPFKARFLSQADEHEWVFMKRRWAVLFLLTAIALPVFAARQVTVEQCEQALNAAKGKPDADAAWQISGMELTERLSAARLAQWQSAFPGEAARQALTALADASVFLDPPPAEIPSSATPDFAAQRRMMALTVAYVSKTIPLLPNFMATRQTVRFEDTPQLLEESTFTPYRPLHRVGAVSATVLYRDGREAVDSAAARKPQPLTDGLTTVGVFGPILATVLLDAAQNKLAWSHWEQGSGGLEAVFSYAVPRQKSHYEVNYCCEAEQSATMVANLHAVHRVPGYHGEIGVDPASGTILRITVEAEFKPDDLVSRAAIMVQYGAVEIGGKTNFCPQKSVAIGVEQMVQFVGPYASPAARQIQPLKTSLNDVVFDQYHMFRAETRVVPANEEASAPEAAANPPAAEAIADASSPHAAPEGSPADPASLPGATAAAPEPAPAPPAEIPEIAVAGGASLPAATGDLPPASAQPGFVLHTTSRLVDIGVVAFDKKGHPVTDLKPENLEIYDNGIKQEMRFFSQAGGAAPQVAATAAQPATPQDEAAFSNRRSASPAAGAAESNTTVLLIDASNLAWGDLTFARQQMLEFLRALPEGERAGIYIMSSGRFEILTEATADHALLAASLSKWMPSAQDVSRAQDEESRNRQQIDWVHSKGDLAHVNGNRVDSPDSVDLSDPGSMDPADARLQELGSNPGRDALGILAGVARHLAALPGHKDLVWVSSDNALADWTDQAVSVDKGSKFLDGAALRVQEAMNDAHVAVYPLDASQLEAGSTGADIGTRNVLVVGKSDRDKAYAALGDAAPNEKPGRLTSQMQQDLHPIQGVYREVADATGGRTFRRSGSIATELNGVADDGRAAYLLSFTPGEPADDQYHHLTVKVIGRRDITLRYRTGYEYAKEPTSPRDRFRRAVWQPADMGRQEKRPAPEHRRYRPGPGPVGRDVGGQARHLSGGARRRRTARAGERTKHGPSPEAGDLSEAAARRNPLRRGGRNPTGDGLGEDRCSGRKLRPHGLGYRAGGGRS